MHNYNLKNASKARKLGTLQKMWIMWIMCITISKHCIQDIKNPQPDVKSFSHRNVDNVDKLFLEEVLSNFINVSGAHSYQQVTVDTIFF